MTVDNTQHPFSSDRPIATRAEDILGRANFAEALAAAIKSWKGKDSLVIAIYGQWGSGKTSVKNMVLDGLHKSKEDCPEIVEFNPWQWAGQEQLANAFFEEVGKVLGRKTGEKNRQIAKKWKLYGAGLHLTAYVATGFRNSLVGLFLIIAVLGIGGDAVQALFSNALVSAIGYASLGLAFLTKWWGGFAEKLTAVLDANSAAKEKGLAEIKRELALSLKALDRPVLVIVDDVDRLSGEEIRLLFQLIKANADFPNLVYLVLFQLDIVQAALDKLSPAPGQDFLKKIVQVGLDIPRIERTRLEQVLFNGLDRIIDQHGLPRTFDQVRWANVFVPGLRPYFQTLRDVFRFLGTLEFQIGIFKKDGVLEVNPIDLIVVEALRVFEPAVYGRLHDAKALFTSIAQREREEHVRKGVQDIVDAAPAHRRTQIKDLLTELFPTIEWVFSGSHYGNDWFEEWYRDRRICHRDVFDKYFYLAIPVGDIAQAEIERLLATAGDRAGLVTALRALSEQGLLAVAIDRLEAYKQKVSLDNAIPFVTALFDIGDDLPEGAPGFTSLSPEMHLSRIIYWYLKQEGDRDKRAEVLRAAMQETTGLYGPILITSRATRHPKEKHEEDAFLVSEDAAISLQTICLGKIRVAADSGVLARNSQLASILYRWRDWALAEEPKEWVRRLIQTDEGVLVFLTAFLQQSTSQGFGDHAAKVLWRVRLSNLEIFVDIDELEQRVNSLSARDLSEKQSEAINQFRKAIGRKKQGKPETDFLHDDDED